jgi:ubiquinone/menaquinone biosynthesis C-methylase UbiE
MALARLPREKPLSDATHRGLILDQFTRQASPFSSAAMITDEAVLRMVLDAAQPAVDDIVLDVACGPGLVVCAFAPFARSATGVDVTPAMLDRARELAAEKRLRNVAWDQGDAYSLPFANASFSIVVTRYSFHHLLDPAPALREMVRVCAPCGCIVVVDAYASEDPAQAAAFNRLERLRDPSHARSLSLSELKELFARVGLPEPHATLYELRVEAKDLLARAFPNPGDEAKIVEMFRASAADNRLGIPIRLDGDEIHVAYPAAILVAQRAAR